MPRSHARRGSGRGEQAPSDDEGDWTGLSPPLRTSSKGGHGFARSNSRKNSQKDIGKHKSAGRKAKQMKEKNDRIARNSARAAKNLEALVVGISVLPIPQIPLDAIASRSGESGEGALRATQSWSQDSTLQSSEPPPLADHRSVHGALEDGLAELSFTSADWRAERGGRDYVASTREQAAAMEREFQGICAQQDPAEDRAMRLWSFWDRSKSFLAITRLLAPDQIPDTEYIDALTDMIRLGKDGIDLFHGLFCGQPRGLTVEEVFPLHEWVVETLQHLRRYVEYIIELANDLHQRNAAHDGEELEHEATELCYAFYQLCLQVVHHVEAMGSRHEQLVTANIHGIFLLEGLAHKVISFVLDVVRCTSCNHWTYCWNMDDGLLLNDIQTACILCLGLIGQGEQLQEEMDALSELSGALSMGYGSDDEVDASPPCSPASSAPATPRQEPAARSEGLHALELEPALQRYASGASVEVRRDGDEGGENGAGGSVDEAESATVGTAGWGRPLIATAPMAIARVRPPPVVEEEEEVERHGRVAAVTAEGAAGARAGAASPGWFFSRPLGTPPPEHPPIHDLIGARELLLDMERAASTASSSSTFSSVIATPMGALGSADAGPFARIVLPEAPASASRTASTGTEGLGGAEGATAPPAPPPSMLSCASIASSIGGMEQEPPRSRPPLAPAPSLEAPSVAAEERSPFEAVTSLPPLGPGASGTAPPPTSPAPSWDLGGISRSLSADITHVAVVTDEELEVKAKLGHGSFGLVFRAKPRDEEGYTAVKIMQHLKRGRDGKPTPEAGWQVFKKEWEACRALRHRNIVAFERVIWLSLKASTEGLTPGAQYLCIQMEYCSMGSLNEMLKKAPLVGKMDPTEAQLGMRDRFASRLYRDGVQRLLIARQIAAGLHHMHKCGLVHRDLRPTNVVLDYGMMDRPDGKGVAPGLVAKLCDFGACRSARHLLSGEASPIKEQALSVKYQAPEVLLGKDDSTEKCDVFSFGVVVWQLVTLREPWEGEADSTVQYKVPHSNARLPWPSAAETKFSCHDALVDMVTRCWLADPSQRPTMQELLTELKDVSAREYKAQQAKAAAAKSRRSGEVGRTGGARGAEQAAAPPLRPSEEEAAGDTSRRRCAVQ